MPFTPVQYDQVKRKFVVQDLDYDDVTFAPGITRFLVSRDNTGNYNCDGISDHVEINQAIGDLP